MPQLRDCGVAPYALYLTSPHLTPLAFLARPRPLRRVPVHHGRIQRNFTSPLEAVHREPNPNNQPQVRRSRRPSFSPARAVVASARATSILAPVAPSPLRAHLSASQHDTFPRSTSAAHVTGVPHRVVTKRDRLQLDVPSLIPPSTHERPHLPKTQLLHGAGRCAARSLSLPLRYSHTSPPCLPHLRRPPPTRNLSPPIPTTSRKPSNQSAAPVVLTLPRAAPPTTQ